LRHRITDAVEKLGYEVNPVASSLKSRETMNIGVVIPNIHRIFFPQLIKGIQERCMEDGYNLIIYDSDDKLEKEQHYVRMLVNSWVDGIILDSVAAEDDTKYFGFLNGLKNLKKRIPVVSLERQLDGEGMDSVIVDNRKGGRMAAGHLAACGCRRIALITGPLYSCMVRARMEGYREALGQAGLSAGEEWMAYGDFSPQSGYEAMKKLLDKPERPDGVFAANDQMAIGAIKAIFERGLRIPDDIKVVGFDNTFVASIVAPALTTIGVPKYRMGTVVADLLIGGIRREALRPQVVELPVELIVRGSTDALVSADWDLFGW
jgi:DNA-binding LacI/PurR family transcriptional regulator